MFGVHFLYDSRLCSFTSLSLSHSPSPPLRVSRNSSKVCVRLHIRFFGPCFCLPFEYHVMVEVELYMAKDEFCSRTPTPTNPTPETTLWMEHTPHSVHMSEQAHATLECKFKRIRFEIVMLHARAHREKKARIHLQTSFLPHSGTSHGRWCLLLLFPPQISIIVCVRLCTRWYKHTHTHGIGLGVRRSRKYHAISLIKYWIYVNISSGSQ